MSKRALSGSPTPQATVPSPKRAKVELAPQPVSGPSKRAFHNKQHKKRKIPAPPDFGSHDDVLRMEVERVMAEEGVQLSWNEGWDAPEGLQEGMEIELTVKELSSTGDSISLLPNPYPPWVIVTPFAMPQERILVRIGRPAHGHSGATLLKVIEPNNDLRDMSRVKCQYFGKCAGCQYQMLSYDTQLDFKRRVVMKAYQHFSNLPESVIPTVLPTIGSPLQYAYRTKITPHFDAPPDQRTRRGKKIKPPPVEKTNGNTGLGLHGDWELRIGFDQKGGGRNVLDIEECPIATDIINVGLKIARKTVQDTIQNYTRGATLLLRDSVVIDTPSSRVDDKARKPEDLSPKETEAAALAEAGVDDGRGGTVNASAPRLSHVDKQTEPAAGSASISAPPIETKSAIRITNAEEHICVTSPNTTMHERVGPYLFSFPASAFFQNNNSVLVPLTDYVKEAIENATIGQGQQHPTHLVDAYCGSGLFSLMLSSSFEKISGIDISLHSIASAVHNLQLNNLPKDKFVFQTGTASDIFSSVSHFPSTQTAAVIDPPRKGCDEPFLRQLLDFRPKVIVYVSCNVHTQARDVDWLLKTQEQEGRTDDNGAYRIVSIRGFDLFPQTSHVESVAVLVR
ncbi:S-adenosyl-L-methionine-dependent methyltransferase [Calocera viscosa TUFC12733]|uniref:S-adenosyl-L-methionine-dependent methyltransferase n=1 Tax=Calocera viscosa (strain TUFC12733) TaxID=1330018 RepID=A0A167Q9V8_CALVF|nr:S-adenosyl-L-methionine-dependent methyltransferase [Calocera viscosa TUFC12733]